MSVQQKSQREDVPSSPTDLSYKEFCFEEGSGTELSSDLQHGDGRHMACRQPVCPLPLGKYQPGTPQPLPEGAARAETLAPPCLCTLCLSQANKELE